LSFRQIGTAASSPVRRQFCHRFFSFTAHDHASHLPVLLAAQRLPVNCVDVRSDFSDRLLFTACQPVMPRRALFADFTFGYRCVSARQA